MKCDHPTESCDAEATHFVTAEHDGLAATPRHYPVCKDHISADSWPLTMIITEIGDIAEITI